jgi:DNA-binding NarL/FixJ family response regulator
MIEVLLADDHAAVRDGLRVPLEARSKIASTVLDDYISARSRASPLNSLSPLERQILQLVAAGIERRGGSDAVSVAEDGGYVSQSGEPSSIPDSRPRRGRRQLRRPALHPR